MQNQNVWIVVPAYNEGRRLSDTLQTLSAHAERVVVVDDGSTDNSSVNALKKNVWVLRHNINCGQGAALQTGIQFALVKGAEIIVTFDADGQHSAADIAKLVSPIAKGQCEVTLGSRFLGTSNSIPLFRRLLLKLAVAFTRIVSRIDVTDTHNGLRAFSRKAAQTIRIRENRMAHASEILHEIKTWGLSFQEVPVNIGYTPESLAKGQSGWNAFAIAGQFVFGRLVR